MKELCGIDTVQTSGRDNKEAEMHYSIIVQLYSTLLSSSPSLTKLFVSQDFHMQCLILEYTNADSMR
jgi:hypothetical protein